MKLKSVPLLALEVSESVPSISAGLGHHLNEDGGFELLQSSDLQMIYRHMPPIEYLVVFWESFIGAVTILARCSW